MRKFLLLFLVGALGFAQETTVDFTMGSGYANEVYFDFSENSLQSYDREVWDLAFLRVSNYAFATRLNQGKGLNIYEASNDISQWDNIDLSAASGQALHNSPTNWGSGAAEQGSATYGWGEYNPTTHHVVGSVIFLIEDYASDTYYKFMIEDYYGGYSIKYALWDSNADAWGEDQTAVVPNSQNPGHYFNFFSLSTGEIVDASPAGLDWDIVFKRYSEDLGGGTMYTVTGALTSPICVVAQAEEATDAEWSDLGTLSFDEENNPINVMGYDWKALNDTWSYDIVPNRVYYVHVRDIEGSDYVEGTYYRMYFTSFDGSSTGNGSFVYEQQNMSTVDAEGNVKFAVYPNPVKDGQLTLVYDNAKAQGENATVEIYNMVGQRVYNTKLNNATGLYQREIKLHELEKGVYILKFIQGSTVKTEKIIVQ